MITTTTFLVAMLGTVGAILGAGVAMTVLIVGVLGKRIDDLADRVGTIETRMMALEGVLHEVDKRLTLIERSRP